jgi:hypothetical protein
MSLVQKLISDKIDVIGDVHGEFLVLLDLLKTLGYDENGYHPENRKLVFVGDLVDRGPNSPQTVLFVKKLIELGNAQMVLGNHELNLLSSKPKEGSAWYFNEREHLEKKYEPFARASTSEKEEIYQFLASLPIALESDSMRVIHAAWVSSAIEEIRNVSLGTVDNYYINKEIELNLEIETSGLLKAYNEEQHQWAKEQIDENCTNIPFLHHTSKYNLYHQMHNPVRVLTAGVEQVARKQFFASGKWRFVERHSWWDDYNDTTPVIVGHFWRKFNFIPSSHDDENVFQNIPFNSWHGKNNNVFCVDFSIGGRFRERLDNNVASNTRLAALRFPENKIIFDNGDMFDTINFNQSYNQKIKFK